MQQGRVQVDGVVAREPGIQIDPDRQVVACDGRQVVPESFVYVALHKPPGVVCTANDPERRPRAIDLVPAELGRLFTIGRLDANSEGLILLTNDGEFAQRLAHPRHHMRKVYELWLHAPLTEADIKVWLSGVMDQGERLRALKIRALPSGRAGFGYEVELGEGKNRHLRRMAACSKKSVLRLKRVAIGPLPLGSLKRAAWRHLTEPEVAKLSGGA
jgi:pseudouridine synthase